MDIRYVVIIALVLVVGYIAGLASFYVLPIERPKEVTTTTVTETVTKTVTSTTTVPTTITITLRETTTVVETVVEWPKRIVDALGREVVFESPPKRVVSTMPSTTEKLFALDLGGVVVGVDSYSNYPPEVQDLVNRGKIAVVGGPWTLDIEKIVSLNPDLVIMCRGTRPHENQFGPKLEELGIKTFFLICNAARNHYDIYQDLVLLGQIFGVEEKAKEVIRAINDKISSISEKLKDVQKPRILWLVGPPSWGLYSTGGDTFIGWLISTAGGSNIASEYSGWPRLSYEFILAKDPEVIIVTAHDVNPEDIKREIEGTPLVDTSAWRNGRVYLLIGVADDMVSRPGPRVADALEMLAKIIHPEIFGEPQIADVINIAGLSTHTTVTPSIAVEA